MLCPSANKQTSRNMLKESWVKFKLLSIMQVRATTGAAEIPENAGKIGHAICDIVQDPDDRSVIRN